MDKAKKLMDLLKDEAVDPRQQKEARELADWIDARLAKSLPGDRDIYNDLIKLRDKLRNKYLANMTITSDPAYSAHGSHMVIGGESKLTEDDDDYGRLAEMIERMSLDHLLALIAHICEDNAKEADEQGDSGAAGGWRGDAKTIEDASKKVG